ncbi:MAG: twin-arginine translocase TatA/TatE family subunit [Alphaproteobacteria bacterium]|nr:twin-arginine translocase TatA/TatE family subunit [Alphaproteobacteria bacterium]
MGSFSIWHLIVIVVLVVLLFGRGKVSELMGDVAKGIKNFRQGMADDPKPQVTAQPEKPVSDNVKADATKV